MSYEKHFNFVKLYCFHDNDSLVVALLEFSNELYDTILNHLKCIFYICKSKIISELF